MDERFDHRVRRCPRLGGPVTFGYCKGIGDGGRPCWKTIDCWWEQFDVLAYLRRNLSAQDFNALMDVRPKPKLTSLVELIAEAKKRTGGF